MHYCGRIALVIGSLLLSTPAFGGPSGADIHAETLASIGAYDDPELTAYLDKLVREIISVSEMPDKEFTFTLLDSGDINAFATTGNYVYINRGLLNYVNNEAQVVSILAHEVGHITQKHTSLMPVAAGGARILMEIIGLLSGSREAQEAGTAYANSLLKGHGRDNELQADEAAARYMVKLGYDPDQLLEMLGTMKDLEVMQKELAAQGGGQRRSYHGIFSTHPRNDMRLRSAVSKAEAIESPATRDDGAARYREMTEGLVWGENFKEKAPRPERSSDMARRIQFDFPDGWAHDMDQQTGTVSGEPESGEAQLGMKPSARTAQTPEEYLYNYLNISQLREGREISPARLKGFTGILPGLEGNPDQRIAVVYYKMNAYLFIGEVSAQESFSDFDEMFLESIDTFRPISNRQISGQKPKTIHYMKATGATTFEALGEHFKLDLVEVQTLRVINGYYPTGEPRPGEWIRIFRQ
jgi:predicted Zn-dependent protease